MVNPEFLLVAEGSRCTCQYQIYLDTTPAYYRHDGSLSPERDVFQTCSTKALVKLPVEGRNHFCYKHAMETLREDGVRARQRLKYWDDANEQLPTWGGSIAAGSARSDIRTIDEITRILEEYASDLCK